MGHPKSKAGGMKKNRQTVKGGGGLLEKLNEFFPRCAGGRKKKKSLCAVKGHDHAWPLEDRPVGRSSFSKRETNNTDAELQPGRKANKRGNLTNRRAGKKKGSHIE